MKDLSFYLACIGWYNLAGAFFLFTFLNLKFGDEFLRKQCRFLSVPYTLGSFGKTWLWWGAVLNVFYALVIILAESWGPKAMHDVAWLVIGSYSFFMILNAFACFNKTHDKGLYFNFFLFGFWIGWGVYAVI